jgi:predicted alpha/beta hydrolase
MHPDLLKEWGEEMFRATARANLQRGLGLNLPPQIATREWNRWCRTVRAAQDAPTEQPPFHTSAL